MLGSLSWGEGGMLYIPREITTLQSGNLTPTSWSSRSKPITVPAMRATGVRCWASSFFGSSAQVPCAYGLRRKLLRASIGSCARGPCEDWLSAINSYVTASPVSLQLLRSQASECFARSCDDWRDDEQDGLLSCRRGGSGGSGGSGGPGGSGGWRLRNALSTKPPTVEINR
jgi:hypothetical protein